MHPLIPFHIAAGVVALLSGFVAIALRKGSPLHARIGTAFFLSMLAMAGSGTIVALSMPERGTATVGILCCYLVATAWASARRRSGEAGTLELVGLVVALGCAGAFLSIGLIGLSEPDGRLDLLPAPVHFPFAALAALAAALDANFLLRRRLSPSQRIARHLWRMSTALLIAAFSFFLGQQDKLSELAGDLRLNLLPPLAVLAAMVYWIFRVRFSKAFRRTPPRRQPAAAESVPAQLAPEHA